MYLVHGAILHAALTMAKHANQCCIPTYIVVGGYAWLSTEHLKLALDLSRKLAAKFVGPFRVSDAVGAESFRLELPI